MQYWFVEHWRWSHLFITVCEMYFYPMLWYFFLYICEQIRTQTLLLTRINKSRKFQFLWIELHACSNLNFSQLLHNLENGEIKNKIRLYEKTKKRILLANYGILSNQICFDEGLYPLFTNIYIYSSLEDMACEQAPISTRSILINIGDNNVRFVYSNILQKYLN